MSANVWFEEVNTGLSEEILSSVKYKDGRGNLVTLSPKAVTIRRPEEEFISEVYPCVSLYNRDFKQDLKRGSKEPVVLSTDLVNKTVLLEDPSVPFNLSVQIDFWSKFQSDMDDMMKSWMVKHGRQFNLDVVDDGGTKRSCNCLLKGRPTPSNLVSNGKRLFHTIIIYQIWVDLDEQTRYNKPMVVDLDVDIE